MARGLGSPWRPGARVAPATRSSGSGGRSMMALAVAVALATLVPGTAVARTGALPPKVKPVHAPHGTFRHPSAPAKTGGKGRLGFCGGDDWEPNVAVDPATNHVY